MFSISGVTEIDNISHFICYKYTNESNNNLNYSNSGNHPIQYNLLKLCLLIP